MLFLERDTNYTGIQSELFVNEAEPPVQVVADEDIVGLDVAVGDGDGFSFYISY
jgi:hypothetical protein